MYGMRDASNETMPKVATIPNNENVDNALAYINNKIF